MSKVRAWKATAEMPRMYCVTGDLADCFKELSKFCKDEELDFAHAVTVNYWNDNNNWSVNLFY